MYYEHRTRLLLQKNVWICNARRKIKVILKDECLRGSTYFYLQLHNYQDKKDKIL